MVTNLLETEEQLIMRYINLENDIETFKMKKLFANNDSERYLIERKEIDLSSERSTLRSELLKFEIAETSIKIRTNLLVAFTEMRTALVKVPTNWHVSCGQGKIFHDYFAAKILKVINDIVKLNFLGMTTPFLYLSTDKTDSIDVYPSLVLVCNEDVFILCICNARKIIPD
ncbi:MAG: hypothetical protein L3J66_14025 [Bacteroidales bacterium]|nr:hypothetical protein [Bacteroidales bacterium]